jgi:hypothetical protein
MECILTLAELIDGNHIVQPENFEKLLTSDLVDVEKVEHKIKGEQFDYELQPVFVIKKSTYTDAHKKAQQKYRDKNREEYNESQRKFYERKKGDEDWKKKFNERSKENNKIYRFKKRAEKLNNPAYQPKPRGRPRKIVSSVIEK